MRKLNWFEIILLIIWILIGIGLLASLYYVVFVEKDVLGFILWLWCLAIYIIDSKNMWL